MKTFVILANLDKDFNDYVLIKFVTVKFALQNVLLHHISKNAVQF